MFYIDLRKLQIHPSSAGFVHIWYPNSIITAPADVLAPKGALWEVFVSLFKTLQWRHNGHDSVSNHQSYDCLLNRLFRRRWKKTSKLRVTGLCAGNSPGTGEFPAQMAQLCGNVSIWWRHYEENLHYDIRCAKTRCICSYDSFDLYNLAKSDAHA